MVPQVGTAAHGVEIPTSIWLIADWLGFVEPALPGEDMSVPRIRCLSIHLQLQLTGAEYGGPPAQYHPARWKPEPR